MSSLYQKLQEYGNNDYYPYHMPGHKRRLYGEMSSDFLKADITEIDGFDNLHEPTGVLFEAQQKAAKIYGASNSYYLVGGSTSGILSAISAAVPMGGNILMARNCHKSAYHAAYLRNLNVTYLYPNKMQEFDIYDVITPDQVEEALESNPLVDAVLVVSPTYEGRIADVKEIARVVHERNKVLIVDEAHGAHLGFAPGFGRNSNQAGADLVIHSVHKTLPAPTQTALLHLNTERVSRDRVERFLHIYQSSSPSYLLMAGIENALRIVEEDGQELFASFRDQFLQFMTDVSYCKKLRFIPADDAKQDIGKLVIDVANTDISGQQLYEILLEKYHLQLEMAADTYCLAMFTIGDTKEGYERLRDALLEIDRQLESKDCIHADVQIGSRKPEGAIFESVPQKVLSLAKAWDAPWQEMELKLAIGKTSAGFVNLYPPGVPLLVPGECITEGLTRQIMDYLSKGLHVQGARREGTLVSIRVVSEEEDA